MIERHRELLAWWGRLGFALYLIAGTFWALGNMFVRAMGPCPAFSSNTDCYWSPAKTFWLFPGSQIVLLAGAVIFGILLRKWTRRCSARS